MSNFTHLHVHSQYSVMDGLNSTAELLQAAKDLGQNALAITDHGTLSSHRDMQISAKELGMKPILGIEAYISATDRFDKRDTVSVMTILLSLTTLSCLHKISRVLRT